MRRWRSSGARAEGRGALSAAIAGVISWAAPWRACWIACEGTPNRARIDRLNELIEMGPFEVHVDEVFPLEKAADAHRRLDEHFLGKLALRSQE